MTRYGATTLNIQFKELEFLYRILLGILKQFFSTVPAGLEIYGIELLYAFSSYISS